jgi:hypothetical protein
MKRTIFIFALFSVIGINILFAQAQPRNLTETEWPNYTVGSSTNLTVSSGATAVWANQGGLLGISYARGSNRGWIKLW